MRTREHGQGLQSECQGIALVPTKGQQGAFFGFQWICGGLAMEVEGNAMVFTFTDGYLEGSRAFRRLINGLDRIRAYEADSNTIHEILMTSGEGHRLVDDRSLLAIKVACS